MTTGKAVAPLLIAYGLALLACGNSVRVEPDGEGGAGSVVAVAVGAGGASAVVSSVGTGGAGGGGRDPGPVPGCERLEWAGDPVVLPGTAHPRLIHLAAFDPGRVGVVYEDRDGTSDVILSTTLDGAYDAWPPAVQPQVEHLYDELYNDPGEFSSRSDGTFSLSWNTHGIFRFGSPDPVVRFSDYFAGIFLDPEPDGGAYLVDGEPGTNDLRVQHISTLADDAPRTLIGTFPIPNTCGRAVGAFGASGPLFGLTPVYYCNELGGSSTATFASLASTGELSPTGLALPFFPEKHELFARAGGGYWYGVSQFHEDQHVYALSATGQPLGDPWTFQGYGVQDFAPWRDGFVVSVLDDAGISIAVTDGLHLTANADQPLPPFVSDSVVGLLAGGPGDRSILVAIESLDGIEIRRADCVATEGP